jgi:lysophospholipase L1-like esterase
MRHSFASVVVVAALLAACNRAPSSEHAMQMTLPTAGEMQRVAGLRVVFAHQSVGNNILDGVRTIAERENVALRIDKARSDTSNAPGIVHFMVGENGKPESKIEDFRQTLGAKPFGNVDVALMKFCFVDFDVDTDPAKLASDYENLIDTLQREQPQTRFVAVTAPLETLQTGIKAWLKRTFGREPGGYESNARRYAFNDALRKHYTPAQIFDLAHAESAAGGTAHTYAINGVDAEALDPAFSADGAHLNPDGEVAVAAALIRALADQSPERH